MSRYEQVLLPTKKRVFHKKVCRFCENENLKIDYKNAELLRLFLTDRGKIIPRRISGNCSRHQHELTRAIKRSRHIALILFTVK